MGKKKRNIMDSKGVLAVSKKLQKIILDVILESTSSTDAKLKQALKKKNELLRILAHFIVDD